MEEEALNKVDENEVEYSKTSFIIPSCSAWFNLDKIHEIEMQSLPEFFCGKFPHKNPSTYMDYRNFIIKLYREAPNSYLSATSKIPFLNQIISLPKKFARRCLQYHQTSCFP